MTTLASHASLSNEGVSREFLVRHRVCPLRRRPDGVLEVALAADGSGDAVSELADWFGSPAVAVSCSGEEVERMIERLASDAQSEESVSAIHVDDEDTADAREMANQPPVVRYVSLLLREAHDARASDIHLESSRTGLVARFRLDGILVSAPEPPRSMHHAIVSRIKTLSGLDIAERRRPQDGRFRARLHERELDLRVSTVPTMHGESVVIRLLDQGGRPTDLADLGLPDRLRADVSRLIARPHGMLVVTGPTGSGKTTSLYSALQSRRAGAEKIVTVEDPIEYELPGVTQVPVSRQAGVTFASALRAILRQDPDVVMVGEMRDAETAEIAVQAAMTGHFVLTTLHTVDALSAVPRLVDLGVPEFLLSGTVEGILAQRLVRRVCEACAVEVIEDATDLATIAGRPMGSVSGRRGVGCGTCRGTGYSGRTGIFELVRMTDRLRSAVSRRIAMEDIREIAESDGFIPMRRHGYELVTQGITTATEVLRVITA